MITVQGPILRSDGSTFIGRMRLSPMWAPAAIGGDPVLNSALTVNCAAPDGGFVVVGSGATDLVLAAGTWRVTFPSAPEVDTIYLAVPDGVNQIPFADLMVALVAGDDALTDPRVGEGSPEGVVTAGLGRLYWDTLNKGFWIKDTEGGNVGWRKLLA